MARAYCPKLTREAITRREANGAHCVICGAQFEPGDNSVKCCSLACVHENNRRIARDPARTSARFWSKVNKDGPTAPHMDSRCWVWTAFRDRKGYGKFTIELPGGGRKLTAAHRVAWFFEHGRWPEPMGLHKCDNPACVRPSHVYEGTVRENSRDLYARGNPNRPRGEGHSRAVLTESAVRHIRANHRLIKHRELAALHGVSLGALRAVIYGLSWRHLA